MNEPIKLLAQLEPEAQTAEETLDGLSASLKQLAKTMAGPLSSGALHMVQDQKKLSAAIRSTTEMVKNQIHGFDELHLVQKEKLAEPKPPAQPRPSRPSSGREPGGTKQLTKALRELAALLRRLTDRVIPTLGEAILGLLSLLALLGAAFLIVFEPVFFIFSRLQMALQLLGTVFLGVLGLVSAGWMTFGAPVLQAIQNGLLLLGEIFRPLWETVLLPILTGLSEKLGELWVLLQPLWTSLLTAFQGLGDSARQCWEEHILPFLQGLTLQLAPVLIWLGQLVADLTDTAGQLLRDLITGAQTFLNGFTTFLKGTFTGSWKQAWQGVGQIFTGVWQSIAGVLKASVNLIVDLLNAVLRAVTGTVNAVVNAVNGLGITVPDWVPGIGGRRFAPSLPHMPDYQIPKLAKGAVLPANRPFLAMVGDQRRGVNVEAPLDTIKQAVAETLTDLGPQTLSAQLPVELRLDGELLCRAIARVQAGRGAQIGGVFADCY